MATKLSRREQWAKETGRPKSEYAESSQGKAVKKTQKYYKEKKEFVTKKAKTDTKRLTEDFQRVFRAAGIEKSRTEEDYVRNIRNITEDRAADSDDLNNYLTTNRGRTQEDLDVGLAKEARRYSLEMDATQQSLAARNLAYGNLGGGGVRAKEEGDVTAEHGEKTGDISRTARRSFEDLARYEYVKNRQIQTEYGRAEEMAGVKKGRDIQDVDLAVDRQKTSTERGQQDVSFAKKRDYWEIEHSKDSDVANVEQQFRKQRQAEQQGVERTYVLGY